MPNWAGSCWYYMRYLDPNDAEHLVEKDEFDYWIGPHHNAGAGASGGVDLYVGGVEHAVLHLLYSRFWHKVLYDLGYVSSTEPFHKLFNQGMIQAFAYRDDRGQYVPAAEVVQGPDGPDGPTPRPAPSRAAIPCTVRLFRVRGDRGTGNRRSAPVAGRRDELVHGGPPGPVIDHARQGAPDLGDQAALPAAHGDRMHGTGETP